MGVNGKILEIRGQYNTAKVFTDNVEEATLEQITNLCNQEFTKGCKIRIMPDCHAGIGCVIGFTANLGDKVVPNLVGVDIGCGMYTLRLGKIDVDLPLLDKTIHKYIPAGREVHKKKIVSFPELQELHCFRELKEKTRIERSIGTLGGGNHFIELNKDSEENLYLVIHSGSRNLGKQVAEIYQNLAVDLCSGEPKLSRDLCFLTGEYRNRYLHDMAICQRYAILNRETIAELILEKLKLNPLESFHTVHNYINFEDNIIRKGSVSARKGEKIIIPVNMRDGSIIAIGKGNPEWNYSAPHGAGRVLSRATARKAISLEAYQEAMRGIYTTCVNEHTLDESPMVYKPMKEILPNIQDTVEVVKVIKPIYNFKSNR
jgi:tRNA-splicing ligase RtcB